MNSPVEEITQRLLKRIPGIPFQYARAEAEELWGMPATQISSLWLVPVKRSHEYLNPFASEFFCQEILRRLGIGIAVDTFICTASKARALSNDAFIVKCANAGPGTNLIWNPAAVPTGACLVSRIVPDAATLGYVARKVLQTRAGSCDSDKFYRGFDPSMKEIELIKAAMALNGPQYLNICAGRAFLGLNCTPHFGNVLVTKKGQLISLDHTDASFRTGEDLRRLFGFINRGSPASEVLARVSDLTRGDILESVNKIPGHAACGSTAGLAEYFCERLRLWQRLTQTL